MMQRLQTICSPLLIGAVIACSTTTRSVFHPSDPTFSASPGPVPRAFTQKNIADVPKVPMRSVGIIEVSVTRKSDLERAIELATGKGRDLGCWLVIEHSAFLRIGSQAWHDAGAMVFLVHGGPPHAPSVRPPDHVVQFDCVVQGNATTKSA